MNGFFIELFCNIFGEQVGNFLLTGAFL